MVEGISRQIWNLPPTFPKARLHALLEDIGHNIPSIWEDYCGAAIRSWTQILNDEGALGTTALATLRIASAKFRRWPLEMAFHSHRGRLPLCLCILARTMATLLMVDLHHVGGPEVCSRIPIHLDEDGCPMEVQPFPQATHLLQKLTPLWEHGIHNWSQIGCRGPDGRLYILEERELQWANPSLQSPPPEALTQALKFLWVLLPSKDPAHWLSLCQKLTWPQGLD